MSGFKVAEVANSKNDEFYTPAYAITPLLRHLPPPLTQTGPSLYGARLTRRKAFSCGFSACLATR